MAIFMWRGMTMSEYDSIVKCLRGWPHASLEYKGSVDELHDQAADAIEELKKQIDENNNWWEMAKSLMEMITAIPTWISVTDCLPEDPGEYLVYLRSSEKMREDFFDAGLDMDGSYVTTAYYNDQQKIWQIDNDAYNTNLSVVNMEDDFWISHWMPLPNAPEVKK
jgi:hypothetical protein